MSYRTAAFFAPLMVWSMAAMAQDVLAHDALIQNADVPNILTHVSQAAAPQELSVLGAAQTLNEEFRQAPQWRKGATQTEESPKPLTDPSFSWAAGYIWSQAPAGSKLPWPVPKRDFPAWTVNNGAEANPNGDMIAKIGPERSPLTWSSGMLNITAGVMPPDLAKTVNPDIAHDYLSGAISSFPYSQRYGVFAIVAKLPRGKGVWPAFWLVPADKTWPPEIDVFEVLAADTKTLWTTVHWGKDHKSKGKETRLPVDLSEDFHEYAVDWGPETIKFYFDRKLVFSHPTPEDLHKPAYLIANVAVGKPDSWGGAPDGTTKFPTTMQIRSIKAWQRPAYMERY